MARPRLPGRPIRGHIGRAQVDLSGGRSYTSNDVVVISTDAFHDEYGQALVADLFQILVAPVLFDDLVMTGPAGAELLQEIENGLRECLARKVVSAREMVQRSVHAEQLDLVWADVNYPDRQGPLMHPAVILSSRDLLYDEGVAISATASSQGHRCTKSDVRVVPGRASRTGLNRPTWFSPIPRTMGIALLHERVGAITEADWRTLTDRVAAFLGL